MALDGTVLGKVAAEQMAALEQAYGDTDAQIGAVVTIVEVLKPQGEPDEHGNVRVFADVRARFNVGDPFHIVGVLAQASHNLLATRDVTPGEE